MLTFLKNYFTFSDKKGSIHGLLHTGLWEEINYIESLGGTIRGNHYHEFTKELFIILDGEIMVEVQKVKKGELVGKKSKKVVYKGDVFVIDNNINHIFTVLKKSTWINVLSKKIKEEHPDIKRL